MFRNYWKVALRNVYRHPWSTLLDICGLAVGMAVVFMIFLYVQDELSFDRFHENASRIYRLIGVYEDEKGTQTTLPTVPYDLGPRIADDFPEIQAFARVFKSAYKAWFSRKEITSNEEKFYKVDPQFFQIFNFNLIRGNPAEVLREPHSIVISQATARKFFGAEDPVGQTLTLQGDVNYRVTGIFRDVPSTSHFHPDVLGSTVGFGEQWYTLLGYTYILLDEPASALHVRKLLHRFMRDYHYSGTVDKESWVARNLRDVYLQPLTRIHLFSSYAEEIEPQGNVRALILYVFLGFLTLVVVCVNFVNFKIAGSIPRSREVGVRKTLGASRRQVAVQFLTEITVMAFLGMVLAAALTEWMLPLFNRMVGKNLQLDYWGNIGVIVALTGIPLLTGLLAGLYPALFMSSFQPINVLRGELPGGGFQTVRRVLVTVQFAVAVGFLVATFVVYRQLRYIQRFDPGFERDRILAVPAFNLLGPQDDTNFAPLKALKDRLLSQPTVENVSFGSGLPGMIPEKLPGTVVLEEPSSNEASPLPCDAIMVDASYVKTLGLKIQAGRDFDPAIDHEPLDLQQCMPGAPCVSSVTASFILNETAVQALGWESPENALGKRLQWSETNVMGTVTGVVKDFLVRPLYYPVKPLVVIYFPNYSFYKPTVAIKFRTRNLETLLEQVKGAWEEVFPGKPFDYSFMDVEFRKFYEKDHKVSQFLVILTIAVIVICCLGMLGLAAVTVEQRKRELCIRKVLGALELDILVLLWKDFARLVVTACVLGWPFTFVFLQRWSARFAVQSGFQLGIYLIAGLIVAVTALAMVTVQDIRAIRANPAEVLHYE